MDDTELERLERDIAGRIAELAEIDASEVVADRPLRDLGVDSLMVLELVAFIEKRTRIEVPEAAIRKVRTLADIMAQLRNGWRGAGGA